VNENNFIISGAMPDPPGQLSYTLGTALMNRHMVSVNYGNSIDRKANSKKRYAP